VNDQWNAFIVGVFVGTFLFAMVMLTPWSYHYKAVKAIESCEQSLPRDQECILVGVVKPKDK